jgi:hypothetical protein
MPLVEPVMMADFPDSMRATLRKQTLISASLLAILFDGGMRNFLQPRDALHGLMRND